MTLAVGWLWDRDKVTIVSDTATIGTWSREVKPFLALKTLVISPYLCVSYAGDGPEIAAKKILNLRSRPKGLEARNAAAYLAEDGPGREYLVAGRVDGDSFLAYASDGLIERKAPGHTAWIGDPAAFKVFQQGRAQDFLGSEPPMLQLDRFNRVIESDAVQSVGGCVVRVELTTAGFRYIADGSVYFDHDDAAQVSITSPSSVSIKTHPPNYAILRCVPVEGAVPALGIWWPNGSFGRLFAPEFFDEAQVIPADSAREFVAKVERDVGLKLAVPPSPTGLLPE